MALDEPHEDDEKIVATLASASDQVASEEAEAASGRDLDNITWLVSTREVDWILGGAGVVVDWSRGLLGEGLSLRRADALGDGC